MLTVSSSQANFVPVVCDSKSGEKKGIFATIKKMGDYCKDKFSHMDATDFALKVVPRIASNTMTTMFGLAAASSVNPNSSWTPAAHLALFGGIGHIVAGCVEAGLGLNSIYSGYTESEITKGKTTMLKSVGDFFTGAGLMAVSCGAGPLALMPIFTGIGMNVTGAFTSMDKK